MPSQRDGKAAINSAFQDRHKLSQRVQALKRWLPALSYQVRRGSRIVTGFTVIDKAGQEEAGQEGSGSDQPEPHADKVHQDFLNE